MEVFVSNCQKQTIEYGKKLGESFCGGEVVLLSGELGAGKTHLTKGIAEGMKINQLITSPTFAIHNEYEGEINLNHFDFYRLSDISEVYVLGLDEFLFDKSCVCVLEWWDNVKSLFLGKKCIKIDILKLSENQRQITVDLDFNVM